MTDNIKSIRVEFKDFVPEGEYKENEYLNALSLPVENKSVFLVANMKTKLRGFREFAEKLISKGYTVYALPSVCNKVSGAKAVNGNSTEYYRAIATSRIILAVDYLPDFYLKRDGQYVINAAPRKIQSLDDRLGKARTNNKTDFYFKNKSELDKSTQTKLMTAIRFPDMAKRIVGEKVSEKKKLMVAVNLNEDNTLELFKRIAAKYGEYEITLVVDEKWVKDYADDLFGLDENIIILAKQGNILRKKEDDAKIKFLGTEFLFIEKLDDIKDFLPEYIFDYESRKLFGSQKFDKTINILHASFFWIWMLKSVGKEYVHIDGKNCKYMDDEHRAARSKSLSTFDRVYFTLGEYYDLAVDCCEALKENACVLPYIQSNSVEQKELKTVTLGDEKRLLLSMKNIGVFCAKQISSTRYFDEGEANYAIINYTLSEEKNSEKINDMPMDKPLFVIDPFLLLSDSATIGGNDNITYITSLKELSILLPRFGKCFVIGDNMPVEDEAKRLGKEIVYF